jgi:hypothetical protein
MSKQVVIVGGGAAGFFTAINLAEFDASLKITILERSNQVLSKVKISGGGRCNVTHAEFNPNELVKYYPRGEKELRGPFHQFCSGDTMAWFQGNGVELKIEEDGRMFPVTDSSQTIIDCFLHKIKKLNIQLLKGQGVTALKQLGSGWEITTNTSTFKANAVVMATGSSPKMWKLLQKEGHSIVPPVPSLFTFNIQDNRIKDLPGVATQAHVKVIGTKLEASGPLLITHWGMSGPAVLKLSAWGARELHQLNYKFQVEVNWLPNYIVEEVLEQLQQQKSAIAKKQVAKSNPFQLPKRLWHSLVEASGIYTDQKWADINKKQLQELTNQLSKGVFNVDGKSTFKEEFVTAGGIDLKEVNFKTFESKKLPNLYFAGEVLNIDAITGGFNFQNAWTGGYIVAKSITQKGDFH